MTVHILPTLPPERNGLADYAYKLFTHWPDPSEDWHALVLHIPVGAETSWPALTIDRTVPNASDLIRCLKVLAPKKVVLHYVPHAYDGNGNPKWLVDGLDVAKQELYFRLFTIFHEQYVFPRRFGRATFYQRPSRSLFRRLLGLSDRWSTSCTRYLQHAKENGADMSRGILVPIGTNIEPIDTPDLSTLPDAWRLAVFGLAETRARTLELHAPFIQALAKEGRLGSIHLIGSAPTSQVEGIPPDVEVLELYDADEKAISQALLRCHLGLCFNPPEIVTKSGVYAALSAHGVAPVLPPDEQPLDGPWLLTNSSLPDKQTVQTTRQKALDWYQGAGSWPSITRALYAGIHELR